MRCRSTATSPRAELAGRGFEVAEGRLRRTDRQRPGAAIEDVVQRGQLDRVAQRRAGPVSLDVGDVGRGDGSVGVVRELPQTGL